MQNLPIDLFRQNLGALKALLETLVLIETPSNDKAAVDRLGKLMISQLQALGAEVDVFPRPIAGDLVMGRWGAKTGGILLLSHMDTVYDLGTLAHQPFREADGKLYGPGVLDMKGSIAMLLTILRLFREQQIWPRRPIRALFTTDEETGSLASREFIESEAAKADLALCLEPALASGAIKTARKGTGDIELRVQGVAAHAGIDHQTGRNAIEELAYHILEAQKLTDYQRGTTVNVGVVSGGTRANVVPDAARALIDFRIPDFAELKRLEAWVSQLDPVIPGTTLSAAIDLNRPPMPRDATMAQTFAKAQSIARQVGLQMTEGSTGGGSDANFVAPLGIPVLDGLGPVGDGAHSEREFAWLDSFAERSAQLAALLLGW